MDHRDRARILRRLRSLATLELLNIPLQAWAWFGVIGFPLTAANLTGFALVALLLLEGAGYWTAKHRQLTSRLATVPGIRGFAVARTANLVPLTVGTAFAVWTVASAPGAGSIPGLAFALFAWLEHVNYFHVQLMYDHATDLRSFRAKGFRRASLARDLARAGASRRR